MGNFNSIQFNMIERKDSKYLLLRQYVQLRIYDKRRVRWLPCILLTISILYNRRFLLVCVRLCQSVELVWGGCEALPAARHGLVSGCPCSQDTDYYGASKRLKANRSF